MDKVYATLRTFGVLLGIWVILGVVAIVTNQVPELRRGTTASDADLPDGGLGGGAEAVAEAGVPVDALDGGLTETVGATLDAGTASGEDGGPDSPTDAGPAQEAVAGEVSRWTVCPGSLAAPSLAVADALGDDRPEIIVGCPDGWHVLANTGFGLLRVATFRTPDAPADQRSRTGRAAVGDVDGDGRPDLALPLAFETDRRATRGGGLYLVSRDPYGGIREPVRLAPIAAVSATLAAFDGTDGLDIVAMNRANALAQLPSEAWVFSGGAAPTRLSALPSGLSGSGVQVADIDRNGHADVIALAEDRVDLHLMNAAGELERTHTLTLEGAREIVVGDIDGDGAADLAVLGNGLSWIHAGALDGMEPRGVDGTPATLRDLALLDVDSDGHLDFVGWDHPRLMVLQQRPDVVFEPRTGLELAGGSFGPRRVVMTDLDHDGATDDAVMLGTARRGGPLELLLVVNALDGAVLTPADNARPVPDAPLRLDAPLP